MYVPDDTIVAISTPPGRGGVGMVRISGPDAATVAMALLDRREPFVARHATFGHVRDGSPGAGGGIIDQVVCTWFPAPASYTGDDVVEISGHGNPLLLGRIVNGALHRGARLARPGEFTFRAFLNGKLDLVQAEAVADLIEAATPAQATTACDQLEGTLTRAIAELERHLFELLARLEASLDFPNEGYHFVRPAEVVDALSGLERRLEQLIDGSRRGRLVREGRQAVIVGRPNAGKSSLFNALLGSDRAIVTDLPGTTRDLITERCDLDGIPVTLVDTAGMRPPEALVEAEGIARARGAASVADALIVVIDGSTALEEGDRALAGGDGRRTPHVIAITKSDLDPAWDDHALRPADAPRLRVSARTGEGIAALRRAVALALGSMEVPREPVLVTNLRHAGLLDAARARIAAACEALRGEAGEELVAADLQEALARLQEITGRRATEAVLHEIFSRFCIGK